MIDKRALLICMIALVASLAGLSHCFAADGVVLQTPELVVLRHGANESCMLPGDGYRDFEAGRESATLVLEGVELPAGASRIVGKGLSRICWTPGEGYTSVEMFYDSPPLSTIVNAVGGTEIRPYVPQVVVGFGFHPEETVSRVAPRLGARSRTQVKDDPDGTYKLPKMAEVKYSDALVTLNVRNADFREVLWFLSDLGNVSIMLDPYWADEPTGSRRPVGGGADPGSGGGGGGDPGFRGAGEFFPGFITEGTGNLSLNFKDVPFDRALDLVVMSAGLVKVDIWPDSL